MSGLNAECGMSADCNSMTGEVPLKQLSFLSGNKSFNDCQNYMIQIHKSVFLAANGGLISSTSAHVFLLKILGPPDARKLGHYWTLNGLKLVGRVLLFTNANKSTRKSTHGTRFCGVAQGLHIAIILGACGLE